MPDKEEKFYEVEKMSDVKKLAEQPDVVFDNEGNMHVRNRAYERDGKRLWRSVIEHKSLRFYTTKKNKSSKATKKRERQNKKKGRK